MAVDFFAKATIIRLLKDVPLDKSKDDTFYFASLSEQTNYFINKTAYTFTNQSYQRVEKGKMRVQVKTENVYDVTYLMFQNSAYGNKWFYAYVTACEYINDVTTEFTFEIDELQTWYFNYRIPPCFVERQHNATDAVGDNIVEEGLSIGDYVGNESWDLREYNEYNLTDWEKEHYLKNYIVVDFIIPDDGYEWLSEKYTLVDGIYSTSKKLFFDVTSEQQLTYLTEFISKVLGRGQLSSIANVYVVSGYAIPWEASSLDLHEGGIGGYYLKENVAKGREFNYNLPAFRLGRLDGYVPKNNKMYTYPYNFLKVNNSFNNSINLRYEFFKNLTPTFKEYFTMNYPVSSMMIPTNYRNLTDNNKDINIGVSDYPMCAWSGDAYAAWVAQNSVSQASKGLMAGIGLVAGALTGGTLATVGGAISAISLVTGLLSEAHKASIASDNVGGSNQSALNYSNKLMDYYCNRMSVPYNVAQSIDDYFTAFGYAQKRIFAPRTRVRQSFTYIKTVGAIVQGNLPETAREDISKMYNNGIRFWAEKSSFGNLGIDNRTLN